jgi:hypothetical protein
MPKRKPKPATERPPQTGDTNGPFPRVTEAAAANLTSGTAGLLDVVRDLLRIAAAPGAAAADAADLRGIAADLLEPVARGLRLLATTPAEGQTNAPR